MPRLHPLPANLNAAVTEPTKRRTPARIPTSPRQRTAVPAPWCMIAARSCIKEVRNRNPKLPNRFQQRVSGSRIRWPSHVTDDRVKATVSQKLERALGRNGEFELN